MSLLNIVANQVCGMVVLPQIEGPSGAIADREVDIRSGSLYLISVILLG